MAQEIEVEYIITHKVKLSIDNKNEIENIGKELALKGKSSFDNDQKVKGAGTSTIECNYAVSEIYAI